MSENKDRIRYRRQSHITSASKEFQCGCRFTQEGDGFVTGIFLCNDHVYSEGVQKHLDDAFSLIEATFNEALDQIGFDFTASNIVRDSLLDKPTHPTGGGHGNE